MGADVEAHDLSFGFIFFYRFISNPVNSVRVHVMFVISKFTQNVGNHQNTGGQAYGQSKNIYERKNLILKRFR